MITKSALMNKLALGLVHECFTHSTEGEFDVTLMNMAARAGHYELFTAPLDHELVEKIKQIRDWDIDRVMKLTKEQIDEPTLWVLTNNNQHLLIDGTHRLLARATAGFDEFHGYLAPMNKIIRPHRDMMFTNPNHDWGRMEIRDGGIYDRMTGIKI